MNKLIERLEALKKPNDCTGMKQNATVDACVAIVREMCEAEEVVVPRFAVGDTIGDGEVVGIGIEDGEVYYEMSKPGEIIAGMESTTEYSLTEAEAECEVERHYGLNI